MRSPCVINQLPFEQTLTGRQRWASGSKGLPEGMEREVEREPEGRDCSQDFRAATVIRLLHMVAWTPVIGQETKTPVSNFARNVPIREVVVQVMERHSLADSDSGRSVFHMPKMSRRAGNISRFPLSVPFGFLRPGSVSGAGDLSGLSDPVSADHHDDDGRHDRDPADCDRIRGRSAVAAVARSRGRRGSSGVPVADVVHYAGRLFVSGESPGEDRSGGFRRRGAVRQLIGAATLEKEGW